MEYFEWVLLAMGLLAIGFVLWPSLFSGKAEAQADQLVDRDSQVLDLFNEHKADLEEQLKRDVITQAEFDQLSSELELSLLQDMSASDSQQSGRYVAWPLWLVAVLVPVVAFWFYQERGYQADLDILDLQQAKYMEEMKAFHGGRKADITAAVELRDALLVRVEDRPDNLQNRYSLARLSVELGDYATAVANYKYILVQDESAAKIMAELAQVLFLASGNRVTPEVSQLTSRALSLKPNETTALGLAGIEAYQGDNYAMAIEYWEGALRNMNPASGAAQSLKAGVTQAKSLLAEVGGVDTLITADESDEVRLVLNVSLASSVLADPSMAVFVYARAWQGTPMPLAIERFSVAELPKQVVLDKAMAMAPGMDITSVEQLEIIARISRSGSPQPQSGDWQISMGPLSLTDVVEAINLVIETPVP